MGAYSSGQQKFGFGKVFENKGKIYGIPEWKQELDKAEEAWASAGMSDEEIGNARIEMLSPATARDRREKEAQAREDKIREDAKRERLEAEERAKYDEARRNEREAGERYDWERYQEMREKQRIQEEGIAAEKRVMPGGISNEYSYGARPYVNPAQPGQIQWLRPAMSNKQDMEAIRRAGGNINPNTLVDADEVRQYEASRVERMRVEDERRSMAEQDSAKRAYENSVKRTNAALQKSADKRAVRKDRVTPVVDKIAKLEMEIAEAEKQASWPMPTKTTASGALDYNDPEYKKAKQEWDNKWNREREELKRLKEVELPRAEVMSDVDYARTRRLTGDPVIDQEAALEVVETVRKHLGSNYIDDNTRQELVEQAAMLSHTTPEQIMELLEGVIRSENGGSPPPPPPPASPTSNDPMFYSDERSYRPDVGKWENRVESPNYRPLDTITYEETHKGPPPRTAEEEAAEIAAAREQERLEYEWKGGKQYEKERRELEEKRTEQRIKDWERQLGRKLTVDEKARIRLGGRPSYAETPFKRKK